MGEPTCLMRSFSHPSSASRETKEGDPFRALTESISFGRFMSESLAWEKWSTFSHNRYLEEVEQFSKPGSVAQKKAFFEAHYKKRAAMKAAAAVEQSDSIPEQEMVANNVPQTKIAVNSIPEEETTANNVPQSEVMSKTNRDSLGDSLSVEATTDIVIDKQEEDQIIEPARSSDANNLSSEKDSLQNAIAEREEEVIEEKEEVESLNQVEHSKQLDNAENNDMTAAVPEEKMPIEESAEKENVALQKNTVPLPINKRQMSSLSKSSSQSRASKIPKASTKMASSTQVNVGTNVKPKSKSSIGDLLNNKKLTTKSVHMSINLSCHSGLTTKGSIRMSKDSSTATKNSARASINGISKLVPSVNCQSNDKRNRALLYKSVSGGTKVGGILQALPEDSRAKSNGSKTRSPVISSPFSFRSDERAAKRKEFFQKLEEKNITKTLAQVKAKVPLTRPRSPKLGRKPSSNVVQDTGSQLPQRPAKSERIIPKGKQSTTRSVTSLPKKKAHENASPNIQH